jgi:hypothetical protein
VRSGRRAELVIRTGLVVMGLITATPAVALVNRAAIDYYGLGSLDPMVVVLLQHRGVLQLVLGAALVWAAFFPPARLAAALGAITTKSTGLILTLGNELTRSQAPLFTVVFDSVCVALLLGLAVVELQRLRSGATPGAPSARSAT